MRGQAGLGDVLEVLCPTVDPEKSFETVEMLERRIPLKARVRVKLRAKRYEIPALLMDHRHFESRTRMRRWVTCIEQVHYPLFGFVIIQF